MIGDGTAFVFPVVFAVFVPVITPVVLFGVLVVSVVLGLAPVTIGGDTEGRERGDQRDEGDEHSDGFHDDIRYRS